MSEKAPQPEAEQLLEAPERLERLPAHAQKPELNIAEASQEQREQLVEARKQTEAEANTDNPLEALHKAETAPATTPRQINRELKQITLRRELQQIRRQLPAPQRVLSRVIHQPAVRMASEAVGKSISRPSGLLGGGLVAFIGSTGYLYLARHIGFTYNYGVFLLLFVAGFVIGLVLELLVYMATASHRRAE